MDYVRIRTVPGRFRLTTGGDFNANLARCRALFSKRWEPEIKCWSVPRSPEAARQIVELWSEVHGDEEWQAVAVEATRLHDTVREAQAAKASDTPETPKRTALPPWKHQARAWSFSRRVHAGLLHMGMGTGKSKVVVDLIGNDETIRRALILCPKSVIDVWPRQFEIHGVRDIRVIARRKETTKQFRKLLESAREPFVAVLNYEGARYGTDTETCKLKRKEAEPGSLAEWIFAQSWDLVVLDESHRVKDPTGTTGKFASKLRARARKRLCLTGTPMPHSPLDAFSQFRFLDPSIFGDSWTRFRARYAIMGGFRGADGVPKQVIGFQNQNEMAAKMEPLTFTARTEDVLDLPPFVNVDRKFDLGVEERRVYRQLEGALIADVKSGVVTAANALVKLLRLQQVSCGYGRIDDAGAGTNGACARYEQLGTSRRDLLEEVLEGIEPEEPVAVFCRFTPDLAAVRSVAESLGREYVELSGQRNDLRGGVWTTGNVIGVQIQAGGLGVDLTRARHCVYYSLGFSLGDYEQSRARVRRPGQTRAVSYVHLIGRDTVDQQIYEALLAKREVVEYLLAQL